MPLLLESELSLPLEPEDQPQAADTDWMGPENDRSCTKSIPKTAKERRPNMAEGGKRINEPNSLRTAANRGKWTWASEKIQKFSKITQNLSLWRVTVVIYDLENAVDKPLCFYFIRLK